MLIDNQLASSLAGRTPEQLRGTSLENAPRRAARPISTLDATRSVQRDDVTVTVSFVQRVLVQTAIEVIGRRIDAAEERPATLPVADSPDTDPLVTTTPVTTPVLEAPAPAVLAEAEEAPVEAPDDGTTGPVSPLAEKIADRVLHRIGKRLEHALKTLEKIDRHPGQDVRHIEKRLVQVVRELGKALTTALRGTFALLRNVDIDDESGDRLLDEIRDRLLPGVGRLTGELDSRIRTGFLEGIEATAEASVSREQTFSLEVRTQDGDTVTIQIESRTSSSASVEFSRTDAGFSFNASQETLLEQSLTFRVEGDLDAEETAAIQELVNSAEQLSNQFYAGDLEAAFSAAQELQFDTGEISGFELELQQTVQARVAATYREVAALGDLDEPADAGIAAAVTPALAPVPAPEPAPTQDGITVPDTSAPSIEGGVSVQSPFSLAGLEGHVGELTTRFDLSLLFDDAFNLVRQLLAGALQVHPAAGEREA